ncbi:MAG: PilZ domain-containing protein [Planctomycetes bacterium]|nr:PilZ domain-containing protein [Planctomycetota bacterium]
MAGGPDKNQSDWFAEFKKVNKGAPPGTPSKPDSTPAGAKKDSERRRHSRFEIDECQANLYREGILSVFGVGKGNRARAALDLSEGGVRFLIHERLPVGTKVRMNIQMEKYKDEIEASGEVRWCYQSAKNVEDFYAGVQFENLDPVQKRKIALMREWFTSPQYRAVRETKRKGKAGDLSFPK